MKVICEDEEHFEEVPFSVTVIRFDTEENRPKRVCKDCKDKDKYRH